MAAPFRLGIAGLGTVGTGLLRLLETNAEGLAARAGRALEVTAVSARERGRERGVDLSPFRWCNHPLGLVADPEVDVLVELIGGEDGVALELCTAALAAGKPVVTANKAMLARHGAELAGLADSNATTVAFEAAVAGGIPIVKALREGLAANRVQRTFGILNGTCNFILSAMSETGRAFSSVLAEAQTLGYAEADPSFDIDGTDAAHKLSLLAALAFGCAPDYRLVHTEGIRHIDALDIGFAREMGFRIKLLGVARRTDHGIEQRVHPCMVRAGTPISQVNGVFNAVVVEGDQVGPTLFAGAGAGAGPTASAVASDLVDLARAEIRPVFGIGAADLRSIPISPMDRHRGAYYVRLTVVDRPGVLADIAGCLREHRISIESLIQRGRSDADPVPIVLITHETAEAAMVGALQQIAELASVLEPPRMIRIEEL